MADEEVFMVSRSFQWCGGAACRGGCKQSAFRPCAKACVERRGYRQLEAGHERGSKLVAASEFGMQQGVAYPPGKDGNCGAHRTISQEVQERVGPDS